MNNHLPNCSAESPELEDATMKDFQVNGNTLSLALFTQGTNSDELLDLMQSGTLNAEVAFLNASLIPDVFPLLAAAHKTLVSKSRESLTTHTLHSELVYNYSASKHIEQKAVEKLVNGKEIDLEELAGRADQAQIQKH